MKYFITVALLIMIFNNAMGQITESKATQIAMEYIDNLKQMDYLVYRYPKPIDEKSIITTFDKSISLASFKSYVFFVDKQPLKNWSHLCSFLLVNKATGKISETEWKLPPNDLKDWEILTPIADQPVVKSLNLKSSSSMTATPICNPENCYAVIISGGYNSANNWQRYWNDCSAIYSSLVNVYHYLDDHIVVIMSDGTDPGTDRRISGGYDSSPLDLDGDGDDDIGFSATAANIRNVFNTLSTTLGSNDHLFIFVTDHGAQESGNDALMYLWGETFRDDEFATEMNKVTAKDISIVLEQCYSGGFVDDLAGQNRVIMTACASNETSCGMGYYTYDEFVFDWIAAVTDEDPNGNAVNADYNNDGFISMQEAFYYADTNDACTETPQYSSTPSTLGTSLAIDGLIPSITGPSLVCPSGATFSVASLPPGATVSWTRTSTNGNLTIDPDTGYAYATNTVAGTGTVSAIIHTGCGDVTLPAKNIYVGSLPTPVLSGNTVVKCNRQLTYRVDNTNEANGESFYWDSDILSISNETSPTCTVWGDFNGTGYISCTVTACGVSKTTTRNNISVIMCDYLLLSPNPSTDETTVSIESGTEENAAIASGWDMEVFDQSQLLKIKKTKLKARTTTLNTSGWKDGVYIVRAKIGDEVITEKLIVKH